MKLFTLKDRVTKLEKRVHELEDLISKYKEAEIERLKNLEIKAEKAKKAAEWISTAERPTL